MSKDNGGPAFPTVEANYHNENMRSEGISIRDYFAAKALPQAASKYTKAHEDGEYLPEESYSSVAFCAYQLADAMLLERAK